MRHAIHADAIDGSGGPFSTEQTLQLLVLDRLAAGHVRSHERLSLNGFDAAGGECRLVAREGEFLAEHGKPRHTDADAVRDRQAPLTRAIGVLRDGVGGTEPLQLTIAVESRTHARVAAVLETFLGRWLRPQAWIKI